MLCNVRAAFRVVSFSTASILSARQPSVSIRVSTDLNVPGSRAVGRVIFGLRPMYPPEGISPCPKLPSGGRETST